MKSFVFSLKSQVLVLLAWLVATSAEASITTSPTGGGSASTAATATNLAPDPLVVNYAARVSLPTEGSNRLTYAWSFLRARNVHTNVVDAWYGRSNLNHGTLASSQTFLRTNATVVADGSTIRYDRNGTYQPGSATQRIYWLGVPSHPTHTMLVQMKVYNIPGTTFVRNNFFAYWNASISALGNPTQSMWRLCLEGGGGVVLDSQGPGYYDVGTVYDRGGQITVPTLQKDFMIQSVPGTGLYVYTDGVSGDSATTTGFVLAGPASYTGGLTNIEIGYLNATYAMPTMTMSWTLFDKVLNAEEREAAFLYARALDGKDENLIAYGDSRATPNYSGYPEWLGYLETQDKFAHTRIYSGSRGGVFAAELTNNLFLTNIYQWRAGGPVKKAEVWFGPVDWNDFNASDTASNVWTYISNATVKIKEHIPLVKSVRPGFGTSQDVKSRALNQYIYTNAAMFSEIIHFEEAVNGQEFGNAFWSDAGGGLHHTDAYGRFIADWIGAGYRKLKAKGVESLVTETVTTGAFTTTNLYGFTRPYVVGSGGTVSRLRIGTNVLGVTSGVFNLHHRQVLEISNSVAPTLVLLDP